MSTNQPGARTIDQYIAAFPPEVQALLEHTVRLNLVTRYPKGLEEH